MEPELLTHSSLPSSCLLIVSLPGMGNAKPDIYQCNMPSRKAKWSSNDQEMFT